jgi:uncharacterized protein (TIGR03032 family)
MSPDEVSRDAAWAQQHAEWREPGEALSLWQGAAEVDPRLFAFTVSGDWWEALAATGRTLLVSREYEHLLLALTVTSGGPRISFMPLPHPSGIAVDEHRRTVYVASTRNPNQIFDLQPVNGAGPQGNVADERRVEHPLVPVRSRFLPGSTYLHDLAMIGGVLHANAVGQNAIIRLQGFEEPRVVWWPAAMDRPDGPLLDRNYLQLNSIAPGSSLVSSFFSASTDRVSTRRPGHRNFAVDQRGVIFSGATREPVVRGLTRPHSARFVRDHLWVDNSGYGEVGVVDSGRFSPVVRLPGWTRGLHSTGHVAFVGTSQVIPRFRHYAPGLDLTTSICGLHAIDVQRGTLLGSMTWPMGNQIFAIDSVPITWQTGFPWTAGKQRSSSRKRIKDLFYAYRLTGGAHICDAGKGVARFDTLARLPVRTPNANG